MPNQCAFLLKFDDLKCLGKESEIAASTNTNDGGNTNGDVESCSNSTNLYNSNESSDIILDNKAQYCLTKKAIPYLSLSIDILFGEL